MAAGKYNLVGIDLGTSYCSVCYLKDGAEPVPVINIEGDNLTPSVVFFGEEGLSPIVGRNAVHPSFSRPDRFVQHAKRFLGSSEQTWEIDGVIYDPVDISTIILQKLVQDTEKEIGKIDGAVVTVPAHFTGHQRRLTIQAAQQAGLEKVNVVNEPVAAALASSMSHYALGVGRQYIMEYFDEEVTVLVFDLGGGTFDLSIVRYNSEQLRVIAASGEERLGGIDWDQELVNMVAEPLSPICGDMRKDPRSLRLLAQNVETAKRALSDLPRTQVNVNHNGWAEEFILERREFEERTRHLVELARKRTEELLTSCDLTWDQLDRLLLVGGATMMKMIKDTANEFAKNWRENCGGFVVHHPNLLVARGAALFAGMICYGKNPAGGGQVSPRLAKFSTRNIAANSLGIVVREADGNRISHLLIEKGCPLPVTASCTVATREKGQPRATIRIVEGDVQTSQAKVRCICTIQDLPKNLPARSLLDVELTFDADGLLHVIAKHRDTGRLATVSTLFSPE